MQSTISNQKLLECIQNCRDCHAICEQTIIHCLRQGGVHAASDHQRILQDCAQICQLSEDFMLRGSPFHTNVCSICAQICLRCAQSCEQIGNGDSQMKTCADLCRKCAQSCEQMASM